MKGTQWRVKDKKMSKSFTVLTRLYKDGKEYVFTKHGDMFVSIDTEYITDGRLNRELNGANLLPSETLKGAVKMRSDSIEFEKMLAQGYDLQTIAQTLYK